MHLRRLFSVLALGGALSACAPAGPADAPPATSAAPVTTTTTTTTTTQTVTHEPRPTPPPAPSPEQVAASRVPADERARVASLMMVGVTDYDDALWKLHQGVGGIFIPSWADPGLLTEPGRDVAALRAAVGRPFAVAIDFEGGRVQRHSQVLGSYPSAGEMAATMDPAQVEELAHTIGQSLRHHGVTVDFAPVLDVGGAGLDVVGDRAFSADPVVVAEYGAAFARGLERAGVRPVYKHFPGHGQASGDSHLGEVVTPPLQALAGHDLAAFAGALERHQAPVMVGHMVVPGLGDGLTPSSLNPAAYRLLRSGDYPDGHPFGGLTYTDDLSGMKAITDTMSVPQAVTAAIGAGADQALWSSGTDIIPAIDAVQHALASGAIDRAALDDAAFRVQLQLVHSGL
ncbi:glycoside hydrolase family 3 N-terminal domain-containing protein [Corynebacterium guangdongense]|uniref:beta-N-acetylhexosaminidase n=1 Tax=Corynebacterium guangdongense TaxID=1783348 RepID=A0ABU1ZZQ2_9CORY|nr:glycoside hydrolase family 3 N-terminal domain-containing protein [Corynebacterium guangdongense]MDR7330428.1 beta-N-acetylhexosaminidase [Corynebacterium guangdongense]WJZ18986.1 putative lipoprotein YbbD precursor [Corynebacterium guangdongense]